jgi:DNA-binding SARP family transcriptional activator
VKSRLPEQRVLPRERLLALLPRLWAHRLALVVAPAGSGKTTLLGQLAAASGAPAAYHLTERHEQDEHMFLTGLEQSIAAVLPGVAKGWDSVERAANAVGDAVREPTLLLVDDFHLVEGTPAEEAMERFLVHAPPQLAVVLASRWRPRLNWSRLLVSGALIEVGQDDLRFRSWEVERLFRDVYDAPLPPVDLAALERRTDGWAAGLMLFHLATRDHPLAARRRTLASLGSHWKLAREYLTRNVLDTLEDDVRTFLVDTCVLTRLSGPVCDELLGRKGSAAMLRNLEQRQLFTHELADGSFRYHETMRLQLESLLVEQLDHDEIRERFRNAGLLLERTGAFGDAVRAFCRAEAWDDLSRLLGRNGKRFAGGASIWLDELPPAVLRDDPWLLLALARQQRLAGRLSAAAASYRDAEVRFAGTSETEVCRRERLSVAVWLDAAAPTGDDPASVLRAATVRDPAGEYRRAIRLQGGEGRLVEGLAALLAGRCRECERTLAPLAADPDAPPATAAAATVTTAAALLLAGDPRGAAAAEGAAENAERLGLTWLARLGRAVLALDGGPDLRAEARAARAVCEEEGDEWGRRLCELLEGYGALRGGDPAPALLADAAAGFRALGAGTLEAWSLGGLALALAQEGATDLVDTAARADALGHRLNVPPARALAALAMRTVGVDVTPDDTVDLAFPLTVSQRPAAPLQLRCFGALELRIDGRPAALGRLKPQARSALARLALSAGRPVHREVLMEALWPELDPERAAKNLHVLISILRRALEPGMARDESSLIARQGATYRVDLGPDAWVDVLEFERTLEEAAAARAAGDGAGAVAAFTQALDLYGGELLADEGPAEWVVEERARRYTQAVDAARAIAELSLELGRPLAAARATERALALDRHDDELWRTLVGAYTRAGNAAAASAAQRRYDEVLRST